MKKVFAVRIIDSLCKRCGICAAFCTRKVYSVTEYGEVTIARQDACNGCLLCELRCPDFAIDVGEEKE